jgi:hypothetical protein
MGQDTGSALDFGRLELGVRRAALKIAGRLIEQHQRQAERRRLNSDRRARRHATAGADAIIALRCCKLSGRFDDFWARRTAGQAAARAASG